MNEMTQARGLERSSLTLDLTIPGFHLKSPNSPEHWTARHARVKREKKSLAHAMMESGNLNKLFHLPCTVIITRISPRRMDEDNYIASAKAIKDFIAGIIIPGLAPGRADGSEFIVWKYQQERRSKGEYAINIKIYQT